MSLMGQSLPKRNIRTMSAIHPMATTRGTYEPCGAPKRTLVAQAGLPSGTGPLLGPEIPKFSRERFQKLGALRPLLLGWTLRCLALEWSTVAQNAHPLLNA